MKLKFVYALLAVACCFSSLLTAQTTGSAAQVTVFPEVLSAAKWAGFDYEAQLNLSKTGDYKAIAKLLHFSGTLDGDDALKHAVTCLELIPVSGDVAFAAALNISKPTLRKTMLDRLQLAQGRTQNEAMKKPIKDWAPYTWDVLNGKPFAPVAKPDDTECLSSRPHGASGGATNQQTKTDKDKMKAEMNNSAEGAAVPSAIKQ